MKIVKIMAITAAAVVGLPLLGIGALVVQSKHEERKIQQREDRRLSLLVDEYIRVSSHVPKKFEEGRPDFRLLDNPDAGVRDYAFGKEHFEEMNAFIKSHQDDPRIHALQTAILRFGFAAMLTCKQLMGAEVDGEGITWDRLSDYELFNLGCIK